MGIGKGKSDKIDIDNLIGSVNNESKATQEASCLAEKVVELEQATKAFNTAIDRADCIITAFNNSVNELQSRKIGAQVHPQTLKSLNDICTNFVVEVGKQLMYNPQIQISAESGTKRSIFRQKNKTKRSKKRLHTTLIKPEQKVNEDLCSGFIVS